MEETQVIEQLGLNTVDYIALVMLLYGLLRGVRRGLAGELARLAGLGAAVLAGWHFYEPIGEKLEEITRLSGADAYLAGFVTTLLSVWLAAMLLRWAMKEIMELTFKPWINRVGGGLIGVARIGLILSAVFISMSLCRIDFLRDVFTVHSVIGSKMSEFLVPMVESLTKDKPELRFGEDEPELDPEDSDEAESEWLQ